MGSYFTPEPRVLSPQKPYPYFFRAGHSAAQNPMDPALWRVRDRMSLNGGYVMPSFDLSPLYRSTVGFDRVFSLLDSFGNDGAVPGYPPYNIERTGENAYRISVAVAGFTDKELNLEVKENVLTIRGEKNAAEKKQDGEVLYQGIAARAFERTFQLADHVEIKGANLENGLLHVDLVREIPESKKPRKIAIGSGKPAQVIDAKAA
jgi:molecular chaperone IbpA